MKKYKSFLLNACLKMTDKASKLCHPDFSAKLKIYYNGKKAEIYLLDEPLNRNRYSCRGI